MTLERFLDYLKYVGIGIIVFVTLPIWGPLWLLKLILEAFYITGCEVCDAAIDDKFSSIESWNPYYEYDPKTKKPKKWD